MPALSQAAAPEGRGVPQAPPAAGGRGLGHTRITLDVQRKRFFYGEEKEKGERCWVDHYSSDHSLQN